MKPIDKNELYQHVGQFLKGKGIELTEGSYSKGIHATCSLLADAINLSQAGIERAKTGLDKKLDQVRQAIHQRTAPRTSKTPPARAPSNSTPPPNAKSAPRRTNSRPPGRKKAARKTK